MSIDVDTALPLLHKSSVTMLELGILSLIYVRIELSLSHFYSSKLIENTIKSFNYNNISGETHTQVTKSLILQMKIWKTRKIFTFNT